MRRTLLVLAIVAGALACAPEKPDTSAPTVDIFAGTIVGNTLTEIMTVDDADGPGDVVSVSCTAQPGNHVSAAQASSPGNWSCDLTLPSGTYDVTVTATDAAGLTGSTVDQGESI